MITLTDNPQRVCICVWCLQNLMINSMPCEQTPLSRRHANDDSSRSSESATTMDDSTRIIVKICIDFAVLVCGEYPIFGVYYYVLFYSVRNRMWFHCLNLCIIIFVSARCHASNVSVITMSQRKCVLNFNNKRQLSMITLSLRNIRSNAKL